MNTDDVKSLLSNVTNEKESNQDQNIADMEITPLPPAVPSSNKSCVYVWMDKMNKGALMPQHFKEHWRIWVPKIYSPGPNDDCLEWAFDEEQAQKVLFDSLEEFICNGEPRVVLEQLRKMENPPSVCGRAFKFGEPTYSCRECGLDSTCVLCVDCFKQSSHRHHKYKMGTSNGGGCCDCGDTEAWKTDPFCDVHLAGLQGRETPSKKLPEDIKKRAVAAFEAVLRYCFEILSLEHVPGLPPDLWVEEADENPDALLTTADTYCTVLFNDETHTFEQVIGTLTRVIKCTNKNAVEFVTNVDREGRAVVKCSGFQHCNEVKTDIERYTSRHSNRPLKVLVVHAYVVAHQIFAMKLLGWLQQFISHCEGFRITFSDFALNAKLPNHSIVEGIMFRDSDFWKAARMAWHKLFIAAMLMEYESKKALATVFTANYGAVMKDFIKDDHDHSFSIVCFSIQLFTVPTLAHYLIAHHDALYILLNTFNSESARRCNAQGKLEFERNTTNTTFKRAQFILYDLKYLLSLKPDDWSDALRRGFLQGVSQLLKLLSMMQSMDAVVRQVGQHMEYEPEWESAFHLHIKLSPVISLVLEWCGSDKVVLAKAFKSVLKNLHEQKEKDSGGPVEVKELADHSATCIMYDVSSEPVSIHLPLSRFLTGLFLHLEKHELHFHRKEFSVVNKPTPEQIIEPVLRTQAMISQVHAGMWRRNGYSLLNQLYFYHNVKCRTEMLDKDIILLQAGASLIESNEFLIHILNKFNLLNWASPDFEANTLKNPEEDSTRQTINLVEEFLGLLITIVGERHVPGVGQVSQDDRLKKEIIQQLCIKPLSHSELNKTLPDDMNSETGMERVIEDVAEFKKPANTPAGGKGVYELKPAFYHEYNVFFYHYTKEELSKSEEAQRKRRKAAGELECCPPPKLPRLAETFTLVANLLQCDVMLHIMQTVLERALNLRARSFSEPQVHKILHLIGYALQEQESGNYPFLVFTEKSCKWKMYKLLEDLSSCPRIEAHKDLLTWVLSKFKEVAGSSNLQMGSNSAPSTASQSEKSKSEVSHTDKEWRTKMAAQKRAKVMAQMEAMQKHFMKKNAKLFEEAALDNSKSSEEGSFMDVCECLHQNHEDSPVAVGPCQTARVCSEKTYTCILCQEDQKVTAQGPAMVLVAFVQPSTILCQDRSNVDESEPLYLSATLGACLHASTCGHVMHDYCWQKNFDNFLAEETRRPYRIRQPRSFDVEKHEYLCPLCGCLSNTVLPLLPALSFLQPQVEKSTELSFDGWVTGLKALVSEKYKDTDQQQESSHDPTCRYCTANRDSRNKGASSEKSSMPCPIETVNRELGNDAFEKLYGQKGPTLSEDLVEMIHLFAQATYTKGLGVEPHEGDMRVPLLAWKSISYTIHAIEFLLRDTEKPLLGSLSSRQRDSLEGLSRISAVLGSTWSNSTKNSQNVDVGSHALSLLTLLLENPHDGDSVLNWDPFGVLVPLINSIPTLFNTRSTPSRIITAGTPEAYALRLVFLSLIVKILLTTNWAENEVMDVDSQEEAEEEDGAGDSGSVLRLAQSLGVDVGNLPVSEIWRRVKGASLPFLRCCALYFHFVADVPAPAELMRKDAETYENICKYLGLPCGCDALMDTEAAAKLVATWAEHPGLADRANAVKEPLRVNKLVELPEDYSELINAVSTFTCPNRERGDSRNPTMCLVCGLMLCSQSYCCQTELNKAMVGACTYHASKCGAGVSVFLRVRECEILFLRSPNRGSFVCPPYVDEYGETDQGLRRGNPLRLCRDKYKQLNQMWLSHGLHEAIARAIESSSSFSNPPWQHL